MADLLKPIEITFYWIPHSGAGSACGHAASYPDAPIIDMSIAGQVGQPRKERMFFVENNCVTGHAAGGFLYDSYYENTIEADGTGCYNEVEPNGIM